MNVLQRAQSGRERGRFPFSAYVWALASTNFTSQDLIRHLGQHIVLNLLCLPVGHRHITIPLLRVLLFIHNVFESSVEKNGVIGPGSKIHTLSRKLSSNSRHTFPGDIRPCSRPQSICFLCSQTPYCHVLRISSERL